MEWPNASINVRPHPSGMGHGGGMDLKFCLRFGKFDHSFALNAKSFHFNTFNSKPIFLEWVFTLIGYPYLLYQLGIYRRLKRMFEVFTHSLGP